MNYEEFEKLLNKVNLTKKDFAELVNMNYGSITNWSNSNKIPFWVKSWLEYYNKSKIADDIIKAVEPFVYKKLENKK